MASASALDALSFASSWASAAFLASVALHLAADNSSERLAASASQAWQASYSFALAAWIFVSLSLTAWRLVASFAAAAFFALAEEFCFLRLAASTVAVSLASLALRLTAEAACYLSMAALASRA